MEPGQLRLRLHWHGGEHTTLEVMIASGSESAWCSDRKDNTWMQQSVRTFCSGHDIASYREGERVERGEVVLHETSSRSGVSRMTVVHLIKDGVLPAKQSCVGAPLCDSGSGLELPAVQRAIKSSRAFSPDPRQGTLEYQ
jgi:hypothetical protein